ncbi:MAG: hypothetical protein WAV09_00775 [Minisyncoccia bacterium]
MWATEDASIQEILVGLENRGRYWGPRGALQIAENSKYSLTTIDWITLWSGASTNAYKRMKAGERMEIFEGRSLRELFVVNGLKAWFTAFFVSISQMKQLTPEEVFVVGDALSRIPFLGRYGTWILQKLAHSASTSTEMETITLVRLLELKAQSEIDLLVFVWGKMARPTTEEEALRTRLQIQTPAICQALRAVNNAELADIIHRKWIHVQTVRAIAQGLCSEC